ncbi:MAG TPA: hypothetical protein VF070_28445 [Streptosporangiaceae bacterium]
MSTIEDQLRNAYQRATQTVRPEYLRPYALDPDKLVRPARRRWRGVPAIGSIPRVLAPVGAALAVVIIAAAAVFVPRIVGKTARPGVPVADPAASPAFIAVLRLSGVLDVDSARTGRLVAVVRPPQAGTVWQDVAAAGHNRFVLTAVPSHVYVCADTLLYTLTLEDSGRIASLRPYAVPRIQGTLGDAAGQVNLAASTDGSTVALVTANCGKPGPSDANHFPDNVIVLIHGTDQRTWTVPAQYNVTSLSLPADGSELGYVESYNKQPLPSLGSARVLPADTPSGPADAHSHTIFADGPQWDGVQACGEALSADGKTMYLITRTGVEYGKTAFTLSAYDAATDTRLRVLHTWSQHLDSLRAEPTVAGSQALIWGLDNLRSRVAQVDLTTGAARDRQLPSSSDFITGIAW